MPRSFIPQRRNQLVKSTDAMTAAPHRHSAGFSLIRLPLMLFGFVLIGLGVLIWVYPQLLVAAVASLFVMSGLSVVGAAWKLKTARTQVMRWTGRGQVVEEPPPWR